MAHPDDNLKVGTKRNGAGLIWTLYDNQFGKVWKSSAIAENIRVSTDGKPKYYVENRAQGYSTFERAALEAIKIRERRYREAKALVEAYESA